MEYELGHYYRVKYALVCTRNSFLKEPPKDDFEEYAKKIIDRAYFIILNKIDDFDLNTKRLYGRYPNERPSFYILPFIAQPAICCGAYEKSEDDGRGQ